MTTAREQASQAVHDLIKENGGTCVWPDCEKMADAASDVWEPLVKDLLEALEESVEILHESPVSLLIDRAKEALGED